MHLVIGIAHIVGINYLDMYGYLIMNALRTIIVLIIGLLYCVLILKSKNIVRVIISARFLV